MCVCMWACVWPVHPVAGIHASCGRTKHTSKDTSSSVLVLPVLDVHRKYINKECSMLNSCMTSEFLFVEVQNYMYIPTHIFIYIYIYIYYIHCTVYRQCQFREICTFFNPPVVSSMNVLDRPHMLT